MFAVSAVHGRNLYELFEVVFDKIETLDFAPTDVRKNLFYR